MHQELGLQSQAQQYRLNKMEKEITKEGAKKAKAFGVNLPISTKKSIELANFLRFRDLVQAKGLLENVKIKNVAVPMRRYNKDTGHKPGIGPGRYPLNAAKEFLFLLKSAESNAKQKGMDVTQLYINQLIANQGVKQFRSGRQRGRVNKSTHLFVELKEKGKKK